MERAIFTFNVAAEESTRIYGEYLPLDWQEFTAGRWGIVRRFPLGPIAGITPFNFPLNLVAHKVAPAIAAGCPLVLKPAPQTPFTAMLLAEAVQQAGWPDGGLNVLPLSNEDAGLLITDERIKLISFTGSAAVGWQIKKNCGKKKVVLELGGNAGVIVHSDADLAYAADRCVVGGFSYAGQTCISVQRILVERSAYGKFIDLLIDGVKKLKIGDPLDDSTDLGPLIRESDAVRASDWIQEAVHAGARILCGGRRQGSVLEPTVLDRHPSRDESKLPGNLCSRSHSRALRRFRPGAPADQQFSLRPAGWNFYSRRQADLQRLRRTRSGRADRRRRSRIQDRPHAVWRGKRFGIGTRRVCAMPSRK